MTKLTSSEDARRLYNEIRDYIRDATEIAMRGEFVELQSLDERIKRLCDEMHHLKIPDAQTLKPDLDALMEELSELQQLFVDQRDLLSQEITGVGRHKQAAKAYKQQEAKSAQAARRSDDEE